MIKVVRSPVPAILQKNAAEWTRILGACKVTADRNKIIKKYRHEQIKKALADLFSGKCAYCESYILHIDYGHIEHFRPQATFPELTFEWSNLLLACVRCNGPQGKSDSFPNEHEGGPLVNPCDDDPKIHFDFVFDSITKLASVYGKTDRGLLTETTLDLNRLELRKHRSKHVARLVALARLASGDEEAAELLREACKDSSEYAAFARIAAELIKSKTKSK